MMRLSGKVTIVTGSAFGLGRAAAGRFAREGAMVVAADIDATAGAKAVEEIRDRGGRATFVHTDISVEGDVVALLETAVGEFGRLDVLYNNAAVLFHDRDVRAHELSLEVWDQVMGVNLRGTFLCSKHAVPYMLKQGGGSIINLGSPTGMIGCAPNLTAYSTSKAGIFGLTRVMAAAYARDGIRVNVVIPGTMDTPMNGSVLGSEAAREEYREAVPMGRLGRPCDIEGIAVFLASDDSSYCTGGLYTCDGGLTAV
ncbi:MAG TPA: glucose 1-dehydrogenase [Acidobacteriaceae bacterium]|nr:glucose 1-dehydrogenase [Acidobacteriaceae bacterium]